jgi:hypothetical protein
MAAIVPVHALVNGGVILHYFRTSDVYRETGGLGAKVGIKKVKDSDLNGNEEIIPVKELIRSGAMSRIAVRYKNSFGYRRSARILVNALSMPGVFGDLQANRLEGTDYKLESDLVARGQIVGIGQIRRATYY